MFLHPFTALVAGPTGAGKSELLKSIVRYADQLISPPPTRIIWCYAESQSSLLGLQAKVPHLQLTGNLSQINELQPDERTLIIIDDWMSEISSNSRVSELFYRGSHHRNLSVFLLLQNLFHRGSVMRDIHLNTQYLILFKNPRDTGQIKTLARQMFPRHPKYLTEAYDDATREPFGYLIVDLKPQTQDDRRLSSKILPLETKWIYVPRGI